MLFDFEGKKMSQWRLRCFLTPSGVEFMRALHGASAGLSEEVHEASPAIAITLASEEMVRLIREQNEPLRKEVTPHDIFLPSIELDYAWKDRLLTQNENEAADYVDFIVVREFFHNANIVKKERKRKKEKHYKDTSLLIEDVLRFTMFLFTVSFADRQKGLLPI